MSPKSHVAQFKTAEKGLLLLVCVNRSFADTTKARLHDDAMDLLATNRNLEEVLELYETDPRPPTKSFHKMNLCILTYAELTWEFFGDHCHFYKKCSSCGEHWTHHMCPPSKKTSWNRFDDRFIGKPLKTAGNYSPQSSIMLCLQRASQCL